MTTMSELPAKMQTQQATASDAVAEQISALDLDDLDAVAGGAGGGCQDTFRLSENCTFVDNCKKVLIIYTDDDGNCASYAYCDGFATKSDCNLGRFGW